MDVFNNREIAIAIWALVAVAIVAIKPSIRQAFAGVLKAFVHRVILTSLALMAAYISLIVFGLHEAGLWDIGQLKNTILWSVSVAAVSLFRIRHIAEDPNYYKDVLRDNLKLVTALEFVIAFYTLPLWAELIVVPIATFVGVMQAFAEGKKEHAQVARLIGSVLVVLGALAVVYAVYGLVTDFSSFATGETLSDFLLPPTLSILYLPFVYVLSLYIDYEAAFSRLRFAIPDLSVRWFARRRAILDFHVRTMLLKRWSRNLVIERPSSKADITNSIGEVKILSAREKCPPAVPPERGWSPYAASKFLTSEGLVPGDYHRGALGEWYADSPYLKVGDGVLPDNIAYDIEGDEFTAKSLRLTMNTNQHQASHEALQRFIRAARLLFEKALHAEVPAEIDEHLSSEADITVHLQGTEVLVERELWAGQRLGGYTLHFTVRKPDASNSSACG